MKDLHIRLGGSRADHVKELDAHAEADHVDDCQQSEYPFPTDLHAALDHERSLRLAAEAQLSTTQNEIEDLSTSLSEANELVTAERRSLHELQTRYDALHEEAKGLREREGQRANGNRQPLGDNSQHEGHSEIVDQPKQIVNNVNRPTAHANETAPLATRKQPEMIDLTGASDEDIAESTGSHSVPSGKAGLNSTVKPHGEPIKEGTVIQPGTSMGEPASANSDGSLETGGVLEGKEKYWWRDSRGEWKATWLYPEEEQDLWYAPPRF
ncbi:MAG: hypothetical protein Q9226_003078 [Calogaya cf. arnoldii]